MQMVTARTATARYLLSCRHPGRGMIAGLRIREEPWRIPRGGLNSRDVIDGLPDCSFRGKNAGKWEKERCSL